MGCEVCGVWCVACFACCVCVVVCGLHTCPLPPLRSHITCACFAMLCRQADSCVPLPSQRVGGAARWQLGGVRVLEGEWGKVHLQLITHHHLRLV